MAFPLRFPRRSRARASVPALHAFTWCLAVAACEILGGRVQHFLIVGAVKMSEPQDPDLAADLNREALQGALRRDRSRRADHARRGRSARRWCVIALPTVLLVRGSSSSRCSLPSRASTPRPACSTSPPGSRRPRSSCPRAVRTQQPARDGPGRHRPLQAVNDTYGHLVGDRVLKAIAAGAHRASLRDYDRAGRFGGEEFVLLLAQTSEDDACKHRRAAARLRRRPGRSPSTTARTRRRVSVTISIGVTAMARGETVRADRPARRRRLGLYARQANRPEPDRHPRRGEQHGPRRRVRRPPHGRCPGRPDRRFFTPIEVTLRIH